MLGHSMLEQLAPDDRARSPMFRGGKGRKVDLFCDWLPATQGVSVNVKLASPLWSLMGWLSNEKARPPSPSLLARELFGVRAPRPAQERIAAAGMDGFLLGLGDWLLWEHIGNRTRTAVNENRLASWRGSLKQALSFD